MPKFCKYKYLHVKIASLATVKSCLTVSPFCGCQIFHLMHSLWISSRWTIYTSMITASGCLDKVELAVLTWKRKVEIRSRYVQALVWHSSPYIFYFHLVCNLWFCDNFDVQGLSYWCMNCPCWWRVAIDLFSVDRLQVASCLNTPLQPQSQWFDCHWSHSSGQSTET